MCQECPSSTVRTATRHCPRARANDSLESRAERSWLHLSSARRCSYGWRLVCRRRLRDATHSCASADCDNGRTVQGLQANLERRVATLRCIRSSRGRGKAHIDVLGSWHSAGGCSHTRIGGAGTARSGGCRSDEGSCVAPSCWGIELGRGGRDPAVTTLVPVTAGRSPDWDPVSGAPAWR